MPQRPLACIVCRFDPFVPQERPQPLAVLVGEALATAFTSGSDHGANSSRTGTAPGEADEADEARDRPRTAEKVRELILKMAQEDGWGYRRTLCELEKLRIRVLRSTVAPILQETRAQSVRYP